MAAALLAAWYGRRTLDRIQNWGEKMNEIDALYQSVATAEEMAGHAGHPLGGGVAVAAVPARHAVTLGPGVPHGTV